MHRSVHFRAYACYHLKHAQPHRHWHRNPLTKLVVKLNAGFFSGALRKCLWCTNEIFYSVHVYKPFFADELVNHWGDVSCVPVIKWARTSLAEKKGWQTLDASPQPALLMCNTLLILLSLSSSDYNSFCC
jgi:hypothetical protein